MSQIGFGMSSFYGGFMLLYILIVWVSFSVSWSYFVNGTTRCTLSDGKRRKSNNYFDCVLISDNVEDEWASTLTTRKHSPEKQENQKGKKEKKKTGQRLELPSVPACG